MWAKPKGLGLGLGFGIETIDNLVVSWPYIHSLPFAILTHPLPPSPSRAFPVLKKSLRSFDVFLFALLQEK